MTDRATAIHESGHAVAAVLLAKAMGRDLIAVSINRKGDRGGKNWYTPSKHRTDPADHATVLLAGTLAEQELAPESDWDWSGGNDKAKVSDMAGWVADDQDEALRLIREWVARARDFVQQPAFLSAVEAVARELLQKRILTGDEVRRIMESQGLAPADVP